MAKGKVEQYKKSIYSEVPKVDLAPFGMKLFISYKSYWNQIKKFTTWA